jgi:hypothetical protein
MNTEKIYKPEKLTLENSELKNYIPPTFEQRLIQEEYARHVEMNKEGVLKKFFTLVIKKYIDPDFSGEFSMCYLKSKGIELQRIYNMPNRTEEYCILTSTGKIGPTLITNDNRAPRIEWGKENTVTLWMVDKYDVSGDDEIRELMGGKIE